ncbi:MAG: homocysteine S-methyltransferase family protein [Bacteroidales bacterium]|nr:homocysteine S-methyltransferase family protein [Bacteroidales bacterium]MCM1416224.1 homocysteine S-methyltransferase family protein [bacterium]MCM1423345.1 homocysteine S-methyltransferase family protein [bacterium]
MNRQEFQALLKDKPLFLDGATGSNLQKKGMPTGVCPEQWILEHRDIMIELQRQFVEAGSNIVYAPTFTANRIKLAEYGLADRIGSMNRELVALSKEAVGDRAYVAGDLTMTGEQLSPVGKLAFEELIDVYKEQIRYLVDAGADLLVIETMMSLQETRAAVIAAKEVCDLAVMATLTFESDGRTLFGTDAVTAAVVLESLGAAAVGTNCSTGPDQMVDTVRAMAGAVSIPIIAKPNAGLPALDAAGNTVYDMDAATFGTCMRDIIAAGASVIGGCCGTTPDYIQSAKNAVDGMPLMRREKPKLRYLTSERKTVAFGLNDPFLVVGERINPTGKKKLQAALKEGSMELVSAFAEEQEACGAAILDVNMGMSGIDENAMMQKAVETVSAVTSLPLSLDSSHVEVLEAALRIYPGRALVNSVSGESEKLSKLLPIVKKYGAMFILLPLSDAGLPKDLAEKTAIIEQIEKEAYELGFTKEDIVVDGLVATVGANKNAALETLETIRYCKEKGLATICGLSNISFGLPERSFVNTAFLIMAIREGLTMAIANPSQELLMSCAFASDLLLNKKEADIRYIELMNAVAAKREAAGETAPKETGIRLQASAKEQEAQSFREKLYRDVLKGNRTGITADTQSALDEGSAAKTLLDEVLLPAINEVGELFDKGKYFLPQLIASAEAMKTAIEYMEPLLLQAKTGEEMPTVVIATVEGDIHDIGKNLVALMLKNYGFHVIDLGKDVPKETIIAEAKKHNAQVIALSALMTTTMQQMRHVIAYAKEQQVDAKIIVGGAVITQEYADEIGADGYSEDAAEAVKLTQKLLGLS